MTWQRLFTIFETVVAIAVLGVAVYVYLRGDEEAIYIAGVLFVVGSMLLGRNRNDVEFDE